MERDQRAGVSQHVSIYANTTLNYASGSPTANRIANILQIDPGSTLLMGNVTSPLTVGGSVTIFGTLSLGNAPGGDLKAGGSFYNAGVFNPNGRTVIFNGSGSQKIFGARIRPSPA